MLYDVIMILKSILPSIVCIVISLLSLIETNICTFVSKAQKGLIHKIQFILLSLLLVFTLQLSCMLMQVTNETVTSEI